MKIERIESSTELYENPEIAQLLSLCLLTSTPGKLQSLAQSVYGKTQGRFYVLYENEAVVGILGGSEIDRTHFVLKHCAVLPEHRLKGYASALLKHALEERQYRTMEAETGPEAIDFLKAQGFTCKRIKNHILDLHRFECLWKA